MRLEQQETKLSICSIRIGAVTRYVQNLPKVDIFVVIYNKKTWKNHFFLILIPSLFCYWRNQYPKKHKWGINNNFNQCFIKLPNDYTKMWKVCALLLEKKQCTCLFSVWLLHILTFWLSAVRLSDRHTDPCTRRGPSSGTPKATTTALTTEHSTHHPHHPAVPSDPSHPQS